jgi:hypothetical protein
MLLFIRLHSRITGNVMPYIFAGIAVLLAIFFFNQQASADTATAAAASGCGVKQYYNYSELVYLASQAGFGCDAGTAAAIALAESGGNRLAVGDQALAPTNGPAIGLWQINSAKHTTYTQTELLDAQTNAEEAFQVYSDAGGFSPWTTFKSGAYLNFMGS